ncbi:MAG: TraB/GumN family protein [Bacteroidaceae bacterium]|nr:TraB/GumN family protein [Bacteroidaceae bacterium]
MKKIILSTILALAATFTTTAQDNFADGPGWLWQISGNGLSQKSYLFGTCHGEGHNFTKEEVFSITGLEASLNGIKTVLFEGGMNTETTNADTAAIAAEVKKVTAFIANPGPEHFMPEGTNYESLFDSIQHFKRIDMVLTKLAERLNNGEYFKKSPRYWYSLLALTNLYQAEKLQTNVTYVDYILKQEAEERGIDIGYVEDASKAGLTMLSSLFASIDTMSMKNQADALYHLLENIAHKDKQQKFLEGITKIYLKNDTCKMESFIREANIVPGAESEDSQKELLYDRNVAWIPVIKQNITQRPCMVAVGCRHLLGSESLIALLRREGYTVEAVK